MLPRFFLSLTVVLACAAPAAHAEQPAEAFADAIGQAIRQFDLAARTLETRGRDETEAEVAAFRSAWGEVIARFGVEGQGAIPTYDYRPVLLDIDVRLLGVMLVVSMGNRDAARAALQPIRDILTGLQERAQAAAPDHSRP